MSDNNEAADQHAPAGGDRVARWWIAPLFGLIGPLFVVGSFLRGHEGRDDTVGFVLVIVACGGLGGTIGWLNQRGTTRSDGKPARRIKWIFILPVAIIGAILAGLAVSTPLWVSVPLGWILVTLGYGWILKRQ